MNLMPDFCNRLKPTHFATALNTLTRLGINTRDVYLVAIGRYQNFRGEIQEQSPSPGTELDRRTEIRLEVGFSSAVDQLPYQFFFGFGSTTADRTDEWEERARAFMAPFDSAVIRTLAECQLKDLTFGFGLQRENHIRRFLGLFGVDRSQIGADKDEMLLWRNLMPYFHEWTGNPDALCRLLKSVTGCECEIIENTVSRTEIPEKLRTRLGAHQAAIGVDCILGDSFEDIDTGFRLKISNVDPATVKKLLPGGQLRDKIERILAFCAPATAEYSIDVVGFPAENQIGAETENCFLGHTSYAGVS